MYFNARAVKRSTTRAQWREMDRWRRVTKKILDSEMEKRRDVLAKAIQDGAIYGTSSMLIPDDMLQEMVNLPLLVFP